ncbi:MAG: hypothetical protein R3275_10255 [Saprospiraceae bacterium]|nr:hypothetical protein [Saprospiraceae bacterium]
MKRLIIGILGVMIMFSCQKEDNMGNPFDGEIVNQDTVRLQLDDPDPNSIAGIYKNVFKPTCSNIGCHDGTFEPDFRTIESAYNTLIYQEPIKNDGGYTFRVDPFKPETSVILARLEGRLTPSMPIQVEPDSDWPLKSDDYIQNIRNWISAGAPDITGTIPSHKYPRPRLLGAGVGIEDTTWLRRKGTGGPLMMPVDTQMVTFYFAFRHDHLRPDELTYNKIIFSPDYNFPDSTNIEMSLDVGPMLKIERGFYGDEAEYTHKVDINPPMDLDMDVEQWYFRVYVQDDQNDVTEIPTDNGIFYVKNYMSFIWRN